MGNNIKAFQHVNLAVNFSDFALQNNCCDQVTECKDGGSYICYTPTEGCPPLSCVGTSVQAPKVDALDAKILVSVNELDQLREALLNTIKKYAK